MDTLEDLLFALSLANFCFTKHWVNTLGKKPSDYYSNKNPLSRKQLAATALSVMILALVLWGSFILEREADSPILVWVLRSEFLLILGVSVVGIITLHASKRALRFLVRTLGRNSLGIILIVILTCFMVALIFWVRHFFGIIRMIAFFLSPFVLLRFFQLIRVSRHSRMIQEFSNKPLAPYLKLRNPLTPRILWLVFDEMDQRIVFSERPIGLELPEIDRFMKETIYCTNAYPPCRCTEISIPALIIGKMINEARPYSPNELMLYFDDAEGMFQLTQQQNLFSRIRQMGFNCAVSGCYHPYSRLIADCLVECRWYEAASQENSVGDRVSTMVFNQFRSLFETPRFSVFGQSLTVLKKKKQYFSILEDAKEFAANSNLHLILIHWSIPHAPYFYNRSTNEFNLANSTVVGYLGNLALVDRTFGEIRRAMEEGETWENTVIILTSDHWWRGSESFDGKKDLRVPFLLKLAGQHQFIIYDSPFNTVLTHDLIISLLRGELSSLDDTISWLNQHGSYCHPTKV